MSATRAEQALQMRPLTPGLGVEILGVDIGRGIDDALFASIYDAFLAHQIIVFRDQDIPPGRQVEFGSRFGELQVHVMSQYHQNQHPELYFLTNLGPDGEPSGKHPDRGTLEWHTDGSWQRITGQATIMYAEEIPANGGETWFADMYGAYERLDDTEKARLAPLRALHNLDFSRNRRHGEDPLTEAQRREKPPVAQPVVRTHPETGRRAIFLGDHAECIEGMPYEEGRALVEALNAAIIHDDLVYRHRYRPGDLVAWDNRCLLHRATEYDPAAERRVMRRCTVLGEAPA